MKKHVKFLFHREYYESLRLDLDISVDSDFWKILTDENSDYFKTRNGFLNYSPARIKNILDDKERDIFNEAWNNRSLWTSNSYGEKTIYIESEDSFWQNYDPYIF